MEFMRLAIFNDEWGGAIERGFLEQFQIIMVAVKLNTFIQIMPM